MKIQRKQLKKFTRKCAALYRLFVHYQKRVQMVQLELGGCLETC
jgi:hypothetical protein